MKRLIHIFVIVIFALIFLLFYIFELSWDCPIKKYLHFACPGCGLTRSIRALLNLNLLESIKYNVLGIPVAMGVLHIFGGPLLNPMIGAAAMSLSSVSVLANALRLRSFDPNK